MKAKVLKAFEDIHKVGKIYKKGDVITVSKERFAEINKNGTAKGAGILVEAVKEEKPVKKADE